jgi:hypothetical protein
MSFSWQYSCGMEEFGLMMATDDSGFSLFGGMLCRFIQMVLFVL